MSSKFSQPEPGAARALLPILEVTVMSRGTGVVTVLAWPKGLSLGETQRFSLTADQARELAALLVSAADNAVP